MLRSLRLDCGTNHEPALLGHEPPQGQRQRQAPAEELAGIDRDRRTHVGQQFVAHCGDHHGGSLTRLPAGGDARVAVLLEPDDPAGQGGHTVLDRQVVGRQDVVNQPKRPRPYREGKQHVVERGVERLREIEGDLQLHLVQVAKLVAEGALRQGVVLRIAQMLQGPHVHVRRKLTTHVQDVHQVDREALVERLGSGVVGRDESGAGRRKAALDVLGQSRLRPGLGLLQPHLAKQVGGQAEHQVRERQVLPRGPQDVGRLLVPLEPVDLEGDPLVVSQAAGTLASGERMAERLPGSIERLPDLAPLPLVLKHHPVVTDQPPKLQQPGVLAGWVVLTQLGDDVLKIFAHVVGVRLDGAVRRVPV